MITPLLHMRERPKPSCCRYLAKACFMAGVLLAASASTAATLSANPTTYMDRLAILKPGDTLSLAPGIYRHGLPLHGIQGLPGRPITIEGESSGTGTIFLGRADANTISIKDAAYLVVRSLLLDGDGLDVDGVKAEGTSRFAHNITIERLTILNHGSDQQIVGISTKCPAWNWTIRGNVIRGAGTGMYLGNSDGSAPFVGGVIEHNLVEDTIGYSLQIKHQVERPAWMLQEPMHTVIRHNVFSKARGGSAGTMARPNVLLGHWPLSGAGANDSYEIYGNFFFENPHEPLLQVEGNVNIRSNVFFNSRGDALRLAPHKDFPRQVRVERNTVVAKGVGIVVNGADERFVQIVSENAVFAAKPIAGGIQASNVTDTFGAAIQYMLAPMMPPGQMDFSPRGDYLDLQGAFTGDGRGWPQKDFYGRKYSRPTAGAISAGMVVPWRPDLKIQPDKQ